MKLLFCIKALSTPGGGAERVFVDVVNGLQQRGHHAAVLTFEAASSNSFYQLDNQVHRVTAGAVRTKSAQLKALSALRRTVLDHAPDVVIGFMPSSYVPLSAALAFSGIPLVASEHNVPARYRRQPFHWLSILVASRCVARFTAVSAPQRGQYPALVRRKMSVVPNAVSVTVGSAADVLGNATSRMRILAVGRLHEQKDHLSLIRAFAKIADQFPDWEIRILGDGSEENRLKQEIATQGMGSRITLAGTVREIQAEYAAAQLYVISSRYESQGLATVEALAHGLPAIGFSDCPGTNEIIKNGINGILVDPGTDRVGRLAEAMARLMSDDRMRSDLATNAQRYDFASLSHDVLNKWEELLMDVVRSNRIGKG